MIPYLSVSFQYGGSPMGLVPDQLSRVLQANVHVLEQPSVNSVTITIMHSAL